MNLSEEKLQEFAVGQSMMINVLTACCRALIASHPNPDAMKASWDQRISEAMSTAGLSGLAGNELALGMKAVFDAEVEALR